MGPGECYRAACRQMNMVIVFLFVVSVFIGCTYIYRDYYEKGCCQNSTVEKQDQTENRPYTHP